MSASWNLAEERTALLCQNMPMRPPVEALARSNATAGAFLESLIAKEHVAEAILVLARALPQREAVWWACVSFRLMVEHPNPAQENAIAAAVRWVREPNDANRQAAASSVGAPMEAMRSAAAQAALAAGNSGEPPTSAPDPFLVGRHVSSAVILAAAERDSKRAIENSRRCLAAGVHIAAGRYRWDVGLQPLAPVQKPRRSRAL